MLRRLDAAKAQHASKIYTRSALTYKVSILFGLDYISKDNIMKKLLVSTAMLMTLALTGCATTDATTASSNAIGTANTIGMNVLKVAIDNQCRSQIESQNAWRIASVAMTEAQQETVKSNVCGCVSEQAPQQVTIVELGNAAIDSSYRTQLVTRVVAKSLQSCYASFAGQ